MPDPKPPASLDEALLLLQADLPQIAKKQTGQIQNREYMYSDLAAVSREIMPRLAKFGLAWRALPRLKYTTEPETGAITGTRFVLDWKLKHVPSGEAEEGEWPLTVNATSSQARGSELTYARRYALVAATNLAPEDDDDGAAAEQGARARARDAVKDQQERQNGQQGRLRSAGGQQQQDKAAERDAQVKRTQAQAQGLANIAGQIALDETKGVDDLETQVQKVASSRRILGVLVKDPVTDSQSKLGDVILAARAHMLAREQKAAS